MTIANRVRRIYERRPYPPPSRRQGEGWTLPSLEWIDALRESRKPFAPKRIFVAGCGVGTEAFAIAQRFSHAEIVGVDFSPRSIATARRLQRKFEGRDRVRFEVADLSGARLPEIAGGEFDFITCHGVLSYVPEISAALRNLRRCLAREGVLLLGVNGAAHPSVRWRLLLPEFGFDLDDFNDGAAVRGVLRVFDSLTPYPVALAGQDASYLSGDVFGPLNRALPLTEWRSLCGKAGLYFRGSHASYFAIRDLLNAGLVSVLMPRSRAAVAEFVDALQPAGFHHLIFTRERPRETPWLEERELLGRVPVLTSLYRIRRPRSNSSWHALRDVILKSPSTNTKVELRVPQWEVEILKSSDGVRPLASILERVRPRVPAKSLREAMYLLYQLCVVNLLPPRA